MEEAIYNFLNMVFDEFIYPLTNAIFTIFSDVLVADNTFFTTFFNWLFNIGRETPVEYFPVGVDYQATHFFRDLIMIILFLMALYLIYKLIKIIFKPIFKLFNVGSDVKWRR